MARILPTYLWKSFFIPVIIVLILNSAVLEAFSWKSLVGKSEEEATREATDGAGSSEEKSARKIEDLPRFCSIKKASRRIAKCSYHHTNDIDKARASPANLDRPDGLYPPWMNATLAIQGQKFAHKYLFSVLLGHMFGLFSSPFPDGIHLLTFSTCSDNPVNARKRYLATVAQVMAWYQDYIVEKDPWVNSTASIIWKSFDGVRQRHKAVADAARVQKRAKGMLVNNTYFADYELTTAVRGPFFQDLEEGIPEKNRTLPPSNWDQDNVDPFNHQIAALTQFAFMGYIVAFPERLGVAATDEELWSFVHLWAVIGYAMGIDDKYNICLQANLNIARGLYQEMWYKYTVPSLFHMNRDGKAIMEITMLGLEKITRGVHFSANMQLYLMMKHLLQIPAKHTYEELSLYDKTMDLGIDNFYLRDYRDNAVRRAIMNTATWNAVYLSGLEVFGSNFTQLADRATKVYFAKYE